jgi:hypothetical protein
VGLQSSGPVGQGPGGAAFQQAGRGGGLIEQWLSRPSGAEPGGLWGGGLLGQRPGSLWPSSSFSKSWRGEVFLKLGLQGANISALPYALSQPSVSPASQ